MKRIFSILLIFTVLTIFTISSRAGAASLKSPAQTEQTDSTYRPGELLVKFAPDVPDAVKERTHAKHGSKKIRAFRDLRIDHVEIKKGLSVEQAITAYRAEPGVEYAEPDYIVAAQNVPNDPLFNQLWGLSNYGQTGGTSGADIKAAQKLFAEWPTPIIASGFEVGKELKYPAASIENDFAWNSNHPVVDAYRVAGKMPYDAECWDLTSVLYAVRPDAGFFKLSEPGTISVSDDGNTKFAPAADGNHRYLILDPAQKERVVKTFVELASAKPVVRVPRFRQQQQQQQKKEATKPPEAKP